MYFHQNPISQIHPKRIRLINHSNTNLITLHQFKIEVVPNGQAKNGSNSPQSARTLEGFMRNSIGYGELGTELISDRSVEIVLATDQTVRQRSPERLLQEPSP